MTAMKTTPVLALSCAVLCCSMAVAQSDVPESEMTLATHTSDEIKEASLKESHKIIYLGSDRENAAADSIDYLINSFYVDQYRQFQDPLAPYFLLMSKDAKLALGIGGAVRMRGWYDFAGSIPVNGFIPYEIPVPKDPSQRRKLDGTPDGTAVFMRVIGRNRTLGDIVGYIQGNFQGNGHTFKLKKAYVQFKWFTVGWAPTTLQDADAEAPTIDGAGQNGLLSTTHMLVRWDHRFGKGPWSMAAALEIPTNQVDADGEQTKKISDWFPDVVAFAQYNFAHSGHLRLTGLFKVLPYRDLITEKNRNNIGWAVQLSGLAYPIPRLALYLEANTGRGYQSAIGDLSIDNFDLVAKSDEPGRMYAPLSMGLNVGAKYNFLPNLFAGLALGEAHYFPKYNVRGDSYKYGLYGAVNLFYEPTPRMQVGIEYLVGSRHNFNREHASANRIDALFQFSF